MGKILLPENHITYTAAEDIKTVCKPFFDYSDITYIAHAKVFDDGTCYLISNNQNFLRNFLKKGYTITASPPENLLDKNFYYLVPKNGDHSQAMEDAIRYFDVDNIVNFVFRYSGYYELFCLGSKTNNDNIINFYLNNIDVLIKFFDFFKEKLSDTLNLAQTNKIIMPDHMRSPFSSLDLRDQSARKQTFINTFTLGKIIKNDSITACLQNKIHEKNLKLSERQLECLELLILGKTTKIIAKALSLSPRTVEHYLNNIKTKFSVTSKSELIEKILNN